MSETSKAVFLSYASQDAEAATRIAEALRAAGIEVWFDQSELVGGDAWDQKIRKQIRECALLIPVISKATQGRREAYFRLEWKLADERTHLMAKGTPFLLPVTIDETNDREALVPDSFLAVQWTKAPAGETAPAFAARVKKLLDGGVAGVADPGRARRDEAPGSPTPATVAPRWLRPLFASAVIVIAVLAFTLWKKQREAAAPPSTAPAPASVPAAPLSEARQLAERATKLRRTTGVTTEGLMAAEEMCNRALVLDPLDAEVWAAASMVDTDFVFAQYDRSDARRQQAQKKAARALALAPAQFTARWAQALALAYASGAPGAKVEAVKLFRALAREGAPGDNHDFLLDFGTLLRESGEFAEAAGLFERVGDLEAAGWNYFVAHDADAAERIADQILATKRTTGGMLLKIFVVAMLREDLTAALAVGEFTPAELLDAAPFRATLYGALNLRQFDRAIALVGGYPQDFILLSGTAQPKRYFSGLAHELAGRPAAARAEWQVALQQVAERLKTKPNDRDMMAAHALLLACLGEKEEAEREYQLLRNLSVAGDEHFNDWWVALRLGHTEEALAGLTQLLESRGRGWQFAHFAARREVQWDPLRGDPRFEKLLRDHLPAGARPFDGAQGRPFDDPKPPTLNPGPADRPPADQKSVAVLAFANLSDDKANEYFSDGISEELLNVLAKVPGLKVTARTSSFFFKGKEVPIPEIAQKLGVAYVIEGSVRKQGGKVRITAQLIKAADGFHVWSDTFTRDLKDVFAVQDEIAGLVAQNLELKLGLPNRAPLVVENPEANRLYFEALAAWNQRSPASLTKASELLQQALALEPRFARAKALLSQTVAVGRIDKMPGMTGERALQLADEALALDPSLAQAHAAHGAALGLWVDPKRERAIAEFQRSIELDPNYATGHQWLGREFAAEGRMAEALASLKRAAELDPLSPRILDNYARILAWSGDLPAATTTLDRALQLQPDSIQARQFHAILLLEGDRPEEALAVLKDPELEKASPTAHAQVLLALGREAEARACLAAATDDFERGLILCALGSVTEGWPLLRPRLASQRELILWVVAPLVPRDDPAIVQALADWGMLDAWHRAEAWRAEHPRRKEGAGI